MTTLKETKAILSAHAAHEELLRDFFAKRCTDLKNIHDPDFFANTIELALRVLPVTEVEIARRAGKYVNIVACWRNRTRGYTPLQCLNVLILFAQKAKALSSISMEMIALLNEKTTEQIRALDVDQS